ncbi:MAG TPA: GntG family PLP-dependent aldolase, partial [Planctomycetota bacterium]|nr:GntG family PLP-dependent aldolase [Planctomycetota bacterium]
MRPSDFRSDTVTRPTPAMRAAIAEAEVGDDVLDGDPTVQRLEEKVARLLGKERALFVPSGTMANQVALGCWTRPGDEIVAERHAHVVTWEAGAAGHLHGVQSITLDSPRGTLEPAELARVLRIDSIHCPKCTLITLEQTFIGSGEAPGGRVIPLASMQRTAAFARERGIPVHLDGARLFNAQVASGIDVARYAACADSVSICLSKGLGAPVGSLVAGSEDFWVRARLVRKRLGGWMRQAGVLAAAGLYALEHNVARLAADHTLAKSLARALHGLPGLSCPPDEIETNMVMVQVDHPRLGADDVVGALAAEGVLVQTMTKTSLRF